MKAYQLDCSKKTNKGLQPVHYISRSMTAAEKRYSQTEKDASVVKWAKQGLECTCLEHKIQDHNVAQTIDPNV